MAFVFLAKKKSPFEAKGKELPVPGPGQYMGPIEYKYEQVKYPFNSTTDKETFKSNYDSAPGPGRYNVNRNIISPEKTVNLCFLPATSNVDTDHAKATSNFKSKTKRSAPESHNNVPAPGTYYKDNGLAANTKPRIQPPATNKLQLVQALIKQGKAMVPSIPSQAHVYGYTETDERELVLNQNPALEVYKFVGPGYYDSKSTFHETKTKGVPFHKSEVKKGITLAPATATTNQVGPGTYQFNGLPPPNYQKNQNAEFASRTLRSFDAKVKKRIGFGKTSYRNTVSSTSGGISAAETGIYDEDDDDEDEYIKDATPGPGYYHNGSMISSFSSKSPDGMSTISADGRVRRFPKPVKPQAFGAGKRFHDPVSTTEELGPGQYDVQVNLKNTEIKYTKVPFQSSNMRFEREKPIENPGPGAYDVPVDLVDRVKEKGRSGYVGSFGNTEKRFKISKLLEDTPGPGTYTSEAKKEGTDDIASLFRKGSHFFNSKQGRTAFNVVSEYNAGPGSYDLNHLSIAKKVIKEEDEEDGELPKRYPFNSGQTRFEKPKEKPIPEDEDEDDDDEPRYGYTRAPESLWNPESKGKPSAVFQSKTIRDHVSAQKAAMPGPGAYYDPGHGHWNKKTFNIHFTGD